MTDFYTNVICERGQIYYRGVSGGQRVVKKYNYNPKLYIKSNRDTGWKTLKGDPLEEQVFDSISDAKNFVKKYKDVPNFRIFGSQRYEYAFISDAHPGQVDFDSTQIIIAVIDIEVGSKNGFPSPEQADQPLTAITMCIAGKYYVYAYKDDYEVSSEKAEQIHYIKCEDEEDLIQKFITDWETFSPDIVTGWNIQIFDIPYLVNRTVKLFDEDTALRLSPWKKIDYRKITKKGSNKEEGVYDILGVATIDYIDLYKKYPVPANRESFSLKFIAEYEELGDTKVDYSEYGDLNDLYDKNFKLFIDYNIKDVHLINLLEDKLKLMELVIYLAYLAKVNYEDVFFQVRMWDSIIFNKLKSKKIAIPPKNESYKKGQYEGGYVKDPDPGRIKWLASFDLNSLYPHLIMQYNLSPETLIEPFEYDQEMNDFLYKHGSQICVETLLAKQIPLDWMKAKHITLTPNGQFFRTDIQGFLGELMQEIYDARVIFKNKQTECKKLAEKTDDPEEKKRLKREAAAYGAKQGAYKVTLNSAYGAIGNEFFRFFDVRVAEAVTTSGQLSARWVADGLNEYLNTVIKSKKDIDFIVASDTDSIYITFEPLVKKVLGDHVEDPWDGIRFLDRVCEEKIQPFIDKTYQDLADYVNAYAQKMKMKREALADQGIWTAKKNYILNVYDNEGVKYKTPEIKIVGLAAIKSSTPTVCKAKIKEGIRIILNQSEDDLIKYIDDYRQEFKKLDPYAIALPRSCNGLGEYHDPRAIYGKKCPIQVRGALLFNHYVKDRGLDRKYELIKEGEKVRYLYLKVPNSIHENVISFSAVLPEELGLHKYIDHDTQFNKAFLDPLLIIMNAIGWRLEKNNSLEDLFG